MALTFRKPCPAQCQSGQRLEQAEDFTADPPVFARWVECDVCQGVGSVVDPDFVEAVAAAKATKEKSK